MGLLDKCNLFGGALQAIESAAQGAPVGQAFDVPAEVLAGDARAHEVAIECV